MAILFAVGKYEFDYGPWIFYSATGRDLYIYENGNWSKITDAEGISRGMAFGL